MHQLVDVWNSDQPNRKNMSVNRWKQLLEVQTRLSYHLNQHPNTRENRPFRRSAAATTTPSHTPCTRYMRIMVTNLRLSIEKEHWGNSTFTWYLRFLAPSFTHLWLHHQLTQPYANPQQQPQKSSTHKIHSLCRDMNSAEQSRNNPLDHHWGYNYSISTTLEFCMSTRNWRVYEYVLQNLRSTNFTRTHRYHDCCRHMFWIWSWLI